MDPEKVDKDTLPTLEQLRALPEAELFERFNRRSGKAVAPPELYWSELNRRTQEAQTEAMLGYTRRVEIMTRVILAATLLNLGAAVVGAFT